MRIPGEKIGQPHVHQVQTNGMTAFSNQSSESESWVQSVPQNRPTSIKSLSKSKVFETSTSLHLKRTESSSSKTRSKTELPATALLSPNPQAHFKDNHNQKPRTLQRQCAVQESGISEQDSSLKVKVKAPQNGKGSSVHPSSAQISFVDVKSPRKGVQVEKGGIDKCNAKSGIRNTFKNCPNSTERMPNSMKSLPLRRLRPDSGGVGAGSVAKSQQNIQMQQRRRTPQPQPPTPNPLVKDKGKETQVQLATNNTRMIMEETPLHKYPPLSKDRNNKFLAHGGSGGGGGVKPLQKRIEFWELNSSEVNNNNLHSTPTTTEQLKLGGCCTPASTSTSTPRNPSINPNKKPILSPNRVSPIPKQAIDKSIPAKTRISQVQGSTKSVDTNGRAILENPHKVGQADNGLGSGSVGGSVDVDVGVPNGKSVITELRFVVPLEPQIEVVEGSPLELWVKAKGAEKVIWVKKDVILPHAPPHLLYNVNPADGIYSLKIDQVFLQDSGLYLCELYGKEVEVELTSWCNVQVIEAEEEESLLEIAEVSPTPRKLIVPVIITTSEADMEPRTPPPSSLYTEEDLDLELAADRRLFWATSSPQGSRETYEDALEDICEAADEDCEDEEVNSIRMEEQHRNRKSSDISSPSLKLSSGPRNPGMGDTADQDVDVSLTKDNSVVDNIGELNQQDLKLTSEECHYSGKPQLESQSSTESASALLSEEKDVDGSGGGGGSPAEVSGYPGTFRDSLSDNPLSPKFLMGPSNLIVMLGETVHLRVKIWTPEDSTSEVHWCKLIRGVYQRLDLEGSCSKDRKSGGDGRLLITQPTHDLVMLTITTLTYEDSGKYRVKISNAYGSDYHHCLISVEGPPEPPASPPTAALDELNGQIDICWPCCPFDGGSAILKYILEMKVKDGSESCSENPEEWRVITPPSFNGLCFTLSSKHVQPNHTHHFRVCVENSHGKGRYSRESEGIYVPQDSGGISHRKNSSLTKSGSSELADYYEYTDVSLKHSDFLEYYEKHEGDRLGKGRFGVVFKVTNKATGKPYAGKFVKCRKSSDKDRAELEYKIMNELKYHPKLICLVDAFAMPREIVIVTEMIQGGELFERVVADDFLLTERDCVTFLRQIADGVRYIHDKNIMHLDLKPENILCTQKTSNQIKIIDFGLAQYYTPSDPISVLFGTAEFVSPEIINYDTICPATDMWSVGVITYILLSGLSPFLGDDDNETFSNITRGDFDFEDEAFDKISEDAKDFISSLILKRKEKRLTAQECLDHRWLALSESEKTDIVLSTVKLKRFLLRRKWQKTGNAIRALGRITTLYSSSRRSSSGTSTSSIPTSSSVAGEDGGCPRISTSTLDSSIGDDQDSVFTSINTPPPPQSPAEPNFQTAADTTTTTTTTTNPLPSETKKRQDFATKSKYDESCRSDSGIGGEVLPPSN